MTDFRARYNSDAFVVERGKRRTIVDHFLRRLDTIIAKTVFIGSSVLSVGTIMFPPL